jgi:hypothetical protein
MLKKNFIQKIVNCYENSPVSILTMFLSMQAFLLNDLLRPKT